MEAREKTDPRLSHTESASHSIPLHHRSLEGFQAAKSDRTSAIVSNCLVNRGEVSCASAPDHLNRDAGSNNQYSGSVVARSGTLPARS